jgi:hypothetical protein
MPALQEQINRDCNSSFAYTVIYWQQVLEAWNHEWTTSIERPGQFGVGLLPEQPYHALVPVTIS